MNRAEWFAERWRHLRPSAAIAGIGGAVAAYAMWDDVQWLVITGLLLVVPLVFWLAMIPLLHWKDRYIGGHNTAWGAALLLETSGITKIVYWFRHVLPDWWKSWRYQNVE